MFFFFILNFSLYKFHWNFLYLLWYFFLFFSLQAKARELKFNTFAREPYLELRFAHLCYLQKNNFHNLDNFSNENIIITLIMHLFQWMPKKYKFVPQFKCIHTFPFLDIVVPSLNLLIVFLLVKINIYI